MKPNICQFVVGLDILQRFLQPAATVGGDHVALEITNDGIQYTLVDPAHVALVSATMSSAAMAEYHVRDDAPREVSVQAETLVKWLRALPSKHRQSIVAVVIYDKEISILADLASAATWATSENVDAKPKVPKIDRSELVEMWPDAALLKKTMKSLKTDSAVLRANTLTHTLDMGAYDTELDAITAKHSLPAGQMRGESAQSIMSVDYLNGMVKNMAANSETTLWVGNDYPVILEWADGTAKYTYLQAPRILENPPKLT